MVSNVCLGFFGADAILLQRSPTMGLTTTGCTGTTTQCNKETGHHNGDYWFVFACVV